MERLTTAQTARRLKEHDQILLLTHKRTDGDTCGSAGALCLALRKIGKTAYVQENSETTARNAALMEPLLPPAGFTPKFIVAVDMAAEQMMSPEAKAYEGKVDLCIDHHVSNSFYAKETLLDAAAAAAGEIICDLCAELGVAFDKQIAEYCYIAISSDTGCFKFPSTRAHTMHCAARCYEAGADAASINKIYFDTKTKTRLKLESYIYDHLQFFAGGRGSIIFLGNDIKKELGTTPDDLDNISSLSIQTEGVMLAITLIENYSGGIRASVRSTGAVSAGEFCTSFGGGGHKNAAGAEFAGISPDELLRTLTRAGEELLG